MNHKILLLALIIVTFRFDEMTLFAQVQQEWVSWYSGPGSSSDVPTAIAVDSSGNVYVAGYNSNSPIYGMLIIKYNSAGQQQWAKIQTISPPTTLPMAKKIGVDRQGNIIVAGNDDLWRIFKYDTNGNLLWQQSYQYGWVNSLSIDDSSNIYVCGSGSGTGSSTDYVVIKYNSSGVQQWLAYYDGGYYDWPNSMFVDKNKNIYVTGQSINSSNNSDIASAMFNANGVLQWSNRYPVLTGASGRDITADKDGFCCTLGWGYFGTSQYDDFIIIKHSLNGNVLWAKGYSRNDSSSETPKKIVTDNSGNVIVTGIGSIDFIEQYTTVKYTPTGELTWVKDLRGVPEDMKIDNDNDIYVSGTTYYTNNGYLVNGIGVVKYNANGNEQWVKYWNGPADSGDVFGVSMTIDFNKNVYVLGRGKLIPGISFFDMVTIKYSQPIGIQPIGTEVSTEFKLHQNYPNPFNPITKIKYEIIKNNSKVNLIIYDITGRSIANLVNEKQNKGIYEINFNANEISSGVYFYRLSVDNKIIDTKKMIYLK